MSYFQGVQHYSEEAPSLEKIRQKLVNYQGGEIVCEKNDQDGVAEIRINHLERKNAISGKMMLDLETIVNDLESWKNGKGVILYGANEIFCSGGDLNFARNENNATSGYEMALFMHTTLNRFSNLPLVSVAYISGTGAIGGGAELSTACDFRLCSNDEKTRIGFVHSKMGIVPAWGATTRLVGIVGRRNTLQLLLSGVLLNGAQALEKGLVDGIVQNFEEAREWIRNLVKQDVTVVRAAKACVTNASPVLEEVWEQERRLFAPLWGGAANKRALEMNIKHVKK